MTRRYIYNQTKCGRCGGGVTAWQMAARTAYCCAACQPRLPGTALPAAALQRVAGSAPHVKFDSHCAPDHDRGAPEKLTVLKLREALAAGLRSNCLGLMFEVNHHIHSCPTSRLNLTCLCHATATTWTRPKVSHYVSHSVSHEMCSG
jgi:hypothetical protein